MKKILSTSTLTMAMMAAAPLYAETIYMTDTIDFTLRVKEDPRSKIINMIPSGTELELLHKNNNSGFSHVRTKDGQEGYVLSRHTTLTPGSKVELEKTLQKLMAQTEEIAILKEELNAIKGGNTQALTPNQSLLEERDRARQELNELREASTQTVQLKDQRDQLQEKTIALERELEQLKRENSALGDTASQDWFLYGGAVAFVGFLLGFILPKIGWRRRSSGWDTF